jgi:hypothetical protein
MAFDFLKDLAGAPLVVTDEFFLTNSEGCTKGQALYFASGRLTTAVAAGAIAVIALETKVAGTDVKPQVAIVSPTQVWRVGYTGTPDSAFVVGQDAADIASGALVANAADVTGGAMAIVAKNTTTAKIDVIIKNRQLS